MKITILGAAGVRMPLMIQAITARQAELGLTELSLMDIDAGRLDLVGAVTAPLEQSGCLSYHITRTTDARRALQGADYVLTTFRVGGMEGRVIDERVPLAHGVLGQETTGPGGFAMAVRTIPVLLGYIQLMREVCPDAWLINFANPAGLLAEVILRHAGWERAVGICDGPASVQRGAAVLVGIPAQAVTLEYFGLNHLGWVRRVVVNDQDLLPEFIRRFSAGELPLELPFSAELVNRLGMLPNEYLFYYYSTAQAVQNLLQASHTRGEQLVELNHRLLADLATLRSAEDFEAMQARYDAYLVERGDTYMRAETGAAPLHLEAGSAIAAELQSGGYTGVALDLIAGLTGGEPRTLVLNILNHGSIQGMEADDVVEIPARVSRGQIEPVEIGAIPAESLRLMRQVKQYERMTIQAAVENCYTCALEALITHPLVGSEALARPILDEFIQRHGADFPLLR